MMNNVYFWTLGCSKNDVDTAQMQSLLDNDKFVVSDDIDKADIIVVNTCGFIDSAKEESINSILEASLYKEKGSCSALIVSGCLAQRYPDELMKEIPEIDYIVGVGSIANINKSLEDALEGHKSVDIEDINSDYIEDLKKENVNITEYVKISEGCNNNCSYCIIPKLRGRNRSRKIEDIYDEISYLVSKGTKEVILIAQNTTDYGIDLYGEYKLAELIREISRIDKLKWIRVLYLYPDHLNDELISEFKNNDKLLNYVDIPLQHINDSVLKAMNRKTNKEDIQNIITKLRNEVEGIIIRTTFIVGFPGETDEAFKELYDFIKYNHIDKLGVFKYSREEDTRAYDLGNQVSEDLKEKRFNEIMSLQREISLVNNQKYIGKKYEVLIEEKLDNNEYAARSYMDTPDIDGLIYLHSEQELEINSFVKAEIVDSMEYDLIGEII